MNYILKLILVIFAIIGIYYFLNSGVGMFSQGDPISLTESEKQDIITSCSSQNSHNIVDYTYCLNWNGLDINTTVFDKNEQIVPTNQLAVLHDRINVLTGCHNVFGDTMADYTACLSRNNLSLNY